MKQYFYRLTFGFLVLISSIFSLNAQWKGYSVPESFWPSWDLKAVNSTLWCSGNYGVYKSSDFGLSWTKSYNGPLATVSSSFRKLYAAGNCVWSKMDDGFFATLIKTNDGGMTWIEDTTCDHSYPKDYNGFFNIAIIKDTIYAVTSGTAGVHYWHKHVNGNTWLEYTGININNVAEIPISAFEWNNTWLVNFSNGNWYKTTDGQVFTQVLFNGIPAMSIVYFTGFNSKLFVSGVENISGDSTNCVSSDGGQTWNKITSLPSGVLLKNLKSSGNNVVAYNVYGVTFKSTDDGQNWTQVPGVTIWHNTLESIGGQFFSTQLAKDSVLILQGVNASTALVEPQLQEFNLWPNPLKGNSVTLDLPKEALGKSLAVYIYDANGKLCASRKLISNTPKIDLNMSDLQAGSYLIRISYGTIEMKRTFIKL